MPGKKELGRAGEETAKKYLIKNGYDILESNFRCRCGEIDLIVEGEDYIIFVEVKTRTNSNYGFPVESINYKKRHSIINTAKTYISYKNIKDSNLRFDVIEVITNAEKPEKNNINHIKNAFWEDIRL